MIPRWYTAVCIPAVQLLLAFSAASCVVLLVGENPLDTMAVMITGVFDPDFGLPATLYYATSLTFTGLAVAVAFHAGLLNIGGEGQAYLAGLGVAVICLAFDHILSIWLIVPLAIVAAVGFGAIWAMIPGILQAYRGAHIVVTTIMFNYIAAALMNYLLINYMLNNKGLSIETRLFSPNILIPTVDHWLAPFGIAAFPMPLNFSFIIAILCAIFVWWLLWRSRFGYTLRALGENPKAAQYAGLKTRKIIIITMALSGGLAGLMAINEVYGSKNMLMLNYTNGLGFLGIAVALMGRCNPLGICVAALLFGGLFQGTIDLQFEFKQISPDLILVIQGLVIFFVAALDQMVRKPMEIRYRNYALRRIPHAA